MVVEKSPKLLWGVVALFLYLFLLFLFIYYFNTRNENIAKKYVVKNEDRIQVGLASPKEKIKPKKSIAKKHTKKVVKKPLKKKEKITPKKIVKKKSVKKKSVKKKSVKKSEKKPAKKVVKKSTKTKKIIKNRDKNVTKAKDLFANIHAKKDRKSEVQESKSKRSSKAEGKERLKNKKNKERGIMNAYFSRVQKRLEDWPAQSEFVGEVARVSFSINPSGKFEFKVKSKSNNSAFNEGLSAFLKQLQGIGFGRHTAGRNYTFDAEFIAKE